MLLMTGAKGHMWINCGFSLLHIALHNYDTSVGF
jgi:hypothetical protein